MIDLQTTCISHQFLFIRTRLAMSEGGFLMTIHSMIEVAKDKLNLWGSVSACRSDGCNDAGEDMVGIGGRGERKTYQVKMY